MERPYENKEVRDENLVIAFFQLPHMYGQNTADNN